jgi:hypothetical protein
MSSKCISRVFYSLISSTNKTSSFYKVMSSIKRRSCKILINWMNLEIFKRVYWSHRMLPYVSDYIVKIADLEIIYGVRRKPILHIKIPRLSMMPIRMISRQKRSHGVILVLCREPELFVRFSTLPITKSSCFEIVDLCWPIDRQWHNGPHSSQII